MRSAARPSIRGAAPGREVRAADVRIVNSNTQGSPAHARPDRRLRPRRRWPYGRADRKRRLRRLAVLAPLRFGRLLRGAARHARARPLAACSGRRRRDHAHDPPLSRRHADSRNRLRKRGRRRHRDRLHAARQRLVRAGADRRRPPRHDEDAHGARVALRLRFLDSVGHATDPRGRHEGHRRARHRRTAHAGAAHRQEPPYARGIHGRRRRARAVLARLRGVAHAAAARARSAVDARAHRELLARMGGPLPGAGPLRGRRAPLADHAEGARVRADRRHRRRADHVAAREDRRQPQLGLPLLLAARRDDHAARADARRLLRRGAGLAHVARPRDGRLAGADPDHVRDRRRAPAAGDGARLAARLPGLAAGTRRQRRREPAPARRVRRGDGRAAPRARGRPAGRRHGLGSARCSTIWKRSGRSRTKGSGKRAAAGAISRSRR